MKKTLLLITASMFLMGTPSVVSAAQPSLLYRYNHFLFTVKPTPEWRTLERTWTFRGSPFSPPPSLLVDGDSVPALPEGISFGFTEGWNRSAIRSSIAVNVDENLRREPGSVVIRKSSTGAITFDGVGLPGRRVDLDRATDLTIEALERGVTDIVLPVIETQPQITVEDPELRAQGISEVLTVGESNFSNSPVNRRHNIGVGLQKFNGHLIPQGTVFSFDKTLGRVDGTTGYRKELVIKGDRTEPDYGGGLCQVSTTAYRGVWEYGFPIVKRKNHSYSVSHYFPQGTDATVYPPNVDMQFLNDSPGAILMQTYKEGDLAYFIYYGTDDGRRSDIFGPFLWGKSAPPPDRTEYTATELKPGERKKMGERVPGVKALWYRYVKKTGTGETAEPFFSTYEARPLYYLVGVEAMPATGTGSAAQPTLFMEDQATPAQ